MNIIKHPLTYIGLIFLIPFVAAVIFYNGKGLGLASVKHYGKLVSPTPSPLIPKTEPQIKGNVFFNQGKWHLTLVLDRWSSDASKHIDDLVRIKVATGKDQDKIVLRLVLKDKPFTEDEELQKITFHGKGLNEYQGRMVYLIDPQGLEMMHYPHGWKREEIYKDLRRLLNVSKMS